MLVATALTACGIETPLRRNIILAFKLPLQQHLPLAVLKHLFFVSGIKNSVVATALTACGIETLIRPGDKIAVPI